MKAILAAITISSVITVVISCSCLPQHLQTKYCEANFVVHVLVRTKLKPTTTETRYEVYVLEVYKDITKKIKNWTTATVVTVGPFNSCAIGLSRNQRYILGGTFNRKGELFVRLCGRGNINGGYNSFTECERSLLRGGSNECRWLGGFNCDCQVKYCFPRDKKCKPSRNVCIWNGKKSSQAVCERMYDYTNKPKCQWSPCE